MKQEVLSFPHLPWDNLVFHHERRFQKEMVNQVAFPTFYCGIRLTSLIRIGFGFSPFGRKWVTKGFVLRMPPVLFK